MRWGIAGYGWVARDYMRPGIEAAGGTVVGIADPSPGAREGAPAPAYDDLAAMLRAERPDALYVASPNHAHPAAVAVAAAHRVPVLCEKPMAASVEGAVAIRDDARAASLLYGTAYDQRRHPGHEALRDAIQRGAVGRAAAIRIAYCCWVDPAWTKGTGGNWRADPKAAGGGAVIDLAPHGLDLVHYLLGEEAEDIHMSLQRRVHDYAVEDGGIVSARTASGVLVGAHVAYNTPEALPRRRLEVIGDEAMLTAENTMGQDPGGRVTRTDGRTGAVSDVPFDTEASPFARQAAAFAAAVRGGAHDFDADRDLALTRRVFDAYEDALRCL